MILTKNQTRLAWALRLIAAVIMLQTLYFKFTGAEESVYIFSTLGIEPYGRIGSGIAELIASILILIPSTTAIGALLAVGVMSGAIMSHLTKLGIVVQNDGGQLFIYALLVFISSAILVILYRDQLIKIIQQLKNK
ncbi:MAG: DoxX family protein [Sphingobacteriia bacterium]|jgi:uncharacterized membrane protein YphA (DoxX/SURF4 family)